MLILILVVRHNLSRISQIQQTYFLSEQIGADFDGIIFNGYENQNHIMDIMVSMVITDINIMLIDIYIIISMIKMIKYKNFYLSLFH